MPRKTGAIIPDPINPSGTYRRVICIPGSPEWIALVNGALWVMTQAWYWDAATGDVDAVVDRAKQMYFEFQDGSGDCDPPMTVPVGTIVQFASGMQPDGWLYCNGDEVLKADYPELWDTITTTWGVATLGSDYFVLPDFRNRSPYGFDYGTPSPHFDFASQHGAETHTLTTAQIPSHDHDTYEANLWGAAAPGSGAGLAVNSGGAVAFTAKTGDAGGGNPHNTLHPIAVCGFIIYAGA